MRRLGGDHTWLLLGLVCTLSIAVSTNYTNQGPLLEPISNSFHLTSAEAGLVSTAFFVGSATIALFGGMLSDRAGARFAMSLGAGLVVLSNLGCGLASPSFPALLAWKVVGGLGSGIWFPAGTSYTRGIFRGPGGHVAQGLYGSAFLLGSSSTLVYLPPLAGPGQDWRHALALSGFVVTAVYLLWLVLAPGQGRPSRGQAQGLRFIAGIRNTWLLGLVHMCGFGMAMVVGIWATTYLARTFGLSLEQAGAVGSILLVVGIVGRSGGGAILERGVSPVRQIQVALVLVVGGLALLAAAAPAGSLGMAVVGLVVTGLGVGVPYAAVMNGAAASVPSSPGLAQAFVGWGSVGVAIVGPPLVGALLDVTGSFAAGFSLLAVFTAAVLVSTLALTPFSFGYHTAPMPAREVVSNLS